MRIGFAITRAGSMDVTWTTIHLAVAALELGWSVRFIEPWDFEVSADRRLIARAHAFEPDQGIGVDAMVETIRWRQSNWSNVAYEDMDIVCHGDLIVQTFRVSGIDENGQEFDCRAVDLYPVRDGKLAKKDTYWKGIWTYAV